MRLAFAALACASALLIAGCGEQRRMRSSSRGDRTHDASLVGDGAFSAGGDAESLDLGADADDEAHDAGAPIDASEHRDAAASLDAGAPLDAGARPDATAPPDAGPPAGTVSLVTSGCNADFGGDLVVSFNGSIAVGSLRGSSLAASLQFDLQGQSGFIELSSQHRIQTGLVINLVTWSTWTNLAQDPDAITGQIPDPISGALLVRAYDPARGVMDIELQSVTIQNVSDLSFCTLDGRVETTRLGR
jgi:hypothetical protein